MHGDDEGRGPAVVEEWLLVASGPADLAQGRVTAAHQLVEDALHALLCSLEPKLAPFRVRLELATPDS